MQPSEAYSNTGEPVFDVLRTKHPEARAHLGRSLDAYPGRPTELVPVNLTYEIVIEVAHSLSGGSRVGGGYSIILQNFLLCFEEASGEIRKIFAEFAEWMAN